MKQRLKVDSNGSCVKAMTQLAALTIREGQSVAEFCLVLEKLAGRAYPDIPPEIVSLQKAEILFRQLANWEGSYCIAEAIETSSKDEVYEKVKEVALRLERNRKMASNMSQPLKHLTRLPHTKRKFVDKSPRKFEPSRPRTAVTEDAGTAKADTIRKEPSPKQSVGSSAEETAPIQCFKCGKRGHKARECRETASLNTLNRLQGRQTGSFSAFLDRVLCTSSVSSAVDPTKELFGQKSVVIVEIMGMQAEALLDTGSETSIIPLTLFKFARESKVDLDKYVERIPTVDAVIRNASGEQMKFVDTIRMEVGLNGRKNLVAFHVGGGLDRMVILGTNALETFGIQLTDMTGQPVPLSHTSVHRQEGDLETTTTIQAMVFGRTYIPPGSVKMVKLLGASGDQVFWSSHCSMSHGCCRASTDGTVEIPVINTSDEAMVLKEGQVVGEFANDAYFPLRMASSYSDMMDSRSASQDPAADRVETLMAVLKGRNEVTAALEVTLQEFADVFAVSDKELTQTDLVVHDIDTGEAAPIKQKTRPVPMGARKEFKEIIKDLVERGVVEKSQSEWASPVVLVRKKDGSLRLCIDYRALNKVIKLDSYPLPTIDTVLQSLGGKRVFSSLDLASGYWQIKLSEEAKPKTAFTSSEGLFQFTVLPFGLATSPAAFQRMMDLVLGELGIKDSEVFVYIDDILIATDTTERHYEVLRLVFEAMRRANLKLKAQKCEFFKQEISFLGHMINQEGVATDPGKVEKIREYPRPQNVAQLRTFLGMASYYRKFIFKFARITECLYQLTSPKAQWRWTEREEKAFEEMKSKLTQAPILAQPDMEGAANESNPFVIFTDASTHGLGAVLCQQGKDGFLHPIYFASKKLSKAERNYHITDLEALAVVFAVNKFHFFIYGFKTVVKTDHKPLTSLFKQTNVSARVLRWALLLQKYKLDVQYVAGKANAVADALSRGTAAEEESEQVLCSENEMIVGRTIVEESEWLKELREDDEFRELIAALEVGRTDLEVKMPRSNKKLLSADFTIDEGYLKMVREDTMVKIVPKSKREKVVKEAHEGALTGHFSARKLWRQLRKIVFWDGMLSDVVRWTKRCQKCFLTNTYEKNVPPLKPITTSAPYEFIGIDLVEFGLSEKGNKYALVVVDHFTKFAGAYPIPDKKARTVASVLFER
ncbi:hypothetical protein Aduo_008362 [Ancylostoma duodenale]